MVNVCEKCRIVFADNGRMMGHKKETGHMTILYIQRS